MNSNVNGTSQQPQGNTTQTPNLGPTPMIPSNQQPGTNGVHIKNFTMDENEQIEYPVTYLDPTTIILTDHPMDDYQRSFFSYILLNDKEVDLNIEYTTYKTSIAEQFISPIYQKNKQKHPKKHGRHSGHHRRSKHLLECFEYQLPNLRRNFPDGSSDSEDGSDLNSEENLTELYKRNLCLNSHNAKILDGFIIDNLVDSLQSDLTSPDTENTQVSSGKETRPNISTTDSGSSKSGPHNHTTSDTETIISADTPLSEVSTDAISYSLTKNQKFKLQKIDHISETNQKMINPNNSVIWTFEGGYVFLTGIWRLYQDVMKGLITIPRKNCPEEADAHQRTCAEEFDYVLSHTIFNSYPSHLTKHQNSKKRVHSPVSQREESTNDGSNPEKDDEDSLPDILEEFIKTFDQTKSKYTDLHWNALPSSLRHELFANFKQHLINKKNISPHFFTGFDMNQLIHRIRGGYIKIQGTWIPMEIAKQLCIKFCFPIRYFLVPIFGQDFPEQCHAWFMENQYKMELTRTNIPVNHEIPNNDISNYKKSRASHDIDVCPYSMNMKVQQNHSPADNFQTLSASEGIQQYTHQNDHQGTGLHASETNRLQPNISPTMHDPKNQTSFASMNMLHNGDYVKEASSKPYLPPINSLIGRFQDRRGQRTNEEIQSNTGEVPEKSVVSNTTLPNNQVPPNNMIMMGHPPYHMQQPQFQRTQKIPQQNMVHYPPPSFYEPQHMNGDVNQPGPQIYPLPTPDYYQTGQVPITEQRPQNIYVSNNMVQGRMGVPPPGGQVVYVDKNQHIISPQIGIVSQPAWSNNMQRPMPHSIPGVPPGYAIVDNNIRYPMTPAQSSVVVQPTMPMVHQTQYVSNPSVAVPNDTNNGINHHPQGQYVVEAPNGEKVYYPQQGQLQHPPPPPPQNNQQNPYWSNMRYK